MSEKERTNTTPRTGSIIITILGAFVTQDQRTAEQSWECERIFEIKSRFRTIFNDTLKFCVKPIKFKLTSI